MDLVTIDLHIAVLPTLKQQSLIWTAPLDGVHLKFHQRSRMTPMVMRPRPQFVYGVYEAKPTVGEAAPLVAAADEHRPFSATSHTRPTRLASTGDETESFDLIHSIRPWCRSKTQVKEQQEGQGTQQPGSAPS